MYSVSSSENKKLLANTKTAIDQGIKELLKDKESFPSFEKIDYNKNVLNLQYIVIKTFIMNSKSFLQ